MEWRSVVENEQTMLKPGTWEYVDIKKKDNRTIFLEQPTICKTSKFLQTHHSDRVSYNIQHKVSAKIWKGPMKSFCTQYIGCTIKSGKIGAKTEPATCDIGINVKTFINGTSDTHTRDDAPCNFSFMRKYTPLNELHVTRNLK